MECPTRLRRRRTPPRPERSCAAHYISALPIGAARRCADLSALAGNGLAAGARVGGTAGDGARPAALGLLLLILLAAGALAAKRHSDREGDPGDGGERDREDRAPRRDQQSEQQQDGEDHAAEGDDHPVSVHAASVLAWVSGYPPAGLLTPPDRRSERSAPSPAATANFLVEAASPA